MARIKQKNEEKAEIERELNKAKFCSNYLKPEEIRFFLKHLQQGKADDLKSRKALITVFVNSIYLYDDKITFILNAGKKPVTITDELLDKIEDNVEGSVTDYIGVPKITTLKRASLFFIPLGN